MLQGELGGYGSHCCSFRLLVSSELPSFFSIINDAPSFKTAPRGMFSLVVDRELKKRLYLLMIRHDSALTLCHTFVLESSQYLTWNIGSFKLFKRPHKAPSDKATVEECGCLTWTKESAFKLEAATKKKKKKKSLNSSYANTKVLMKSITKNDSDINTASQNSLIVSIKLDEKSKNDPYFSEISRQIHISANETITHDMNGNGRFDFFSAGVSTIFALMIVLYLSTHRLQRRFYSESRIDRNEASCILQMLEKENPGICSVLSIQH